MPPNPCATKGKADLSRLWNFRAWWLWLVILAACTPTTAPDSLTQNSTWGDIIHLADTPQLHAPTVNAQPRRTVAAWIGADDSGVHHDTRALTDGRITPPIVLPLPPRAPRDSRLWASVGSNLHLLWMDNAPDGTPNLYTAIVNESLGISRGPLSVSNGAARCFDAFRERNGGLWVIWQTGNPIAPNLISANIDPTGLVLRQQTIADAVGCPHAIETDTERYLLWTDSDHALYGAIFFNGRLRGDVVRLADAPPLDSPVRVDDVRIGADASHMVAFWNVTDADGTRATWVASGQFGTLWDAPQILQFSTDETVTVQTGYNGGAAIGAQLDDNGGAGLWASPMRGRNSTILAATWHNGTLGLMVWESGELVGWLPAVDDVPPLLGMPELVTDSERHLTLTWSATTPFDTAALYLTTTR